MGNCSAAKGYCQHTEDHMEHLLPSLHKVTQYGHLPSATALLVRFVPDRTKGLNKEKENLSCNHLFCKTTHSSHSTGKPLNLLKQNLCTLNILMNINHHAAVTKKWGMLTYTLLNSTHSTSYPNAHTLHKSLAQRTSWEINSAWGTHFDCDWLFLIIVNTLWRELTYSCNMWQSQKHRNMILIGIDYWLHLR